MIIIMFKSLSFGKIWVAGKAEPMPPRVEESLGGPPRVAVCLEATLR